TLTLRNGTSITGGSLLIGTIQVTGTVDVEGLTGAIGRASCRDHALQDVIEVGHDADSKLLLQDGTSITDGQIVLGNMGAITATGTLDVESAGGAALDHVAISAIPAGAVVEVAQTSNSTLSLKHGTSMIGGSLLIGASGFAGTVDVEGFTG